MKRALFWFEAILYMAGLFCLLTMGVLAFILWLDKTPVEIVSHVPYVCGRIGGETFYC